MERPRSDLKEVRFRVEGIGGGGTSRTEPLDRFLEYLPYVIRTPRAGEGIFPPFRVLNAILVEGELDAGMSGSVYWEPFELGPEEYHELSQRLVERGYSIGTEPPNEVATFPDWSAWISGRHLPGAGQQSSP